MIEAKISDFSKYSSKNASRMCVCCRDRFLQSSLFRLCVIDEKVSVFCGLGRSFYLCPKCIKEIRVIEKVAKIKRLKDGQKNQLKEIIALWQ